MPRPRKEHRPISLKMDASVFERLEDYCEESGQPKTVAIERAVMMYIDDYDRKKEQIENTANK